MTEFHIPLKQINIIVNKVITINKNDTLYKCMQTFYNEGISLLPVIGDEGEILGYFYLKDIIYFFSMGDKFNFNNTVENFLKDLYEDIDNQKPYGIRRIVELNDDTDLKEVFKALGIKLAFDSHHANFSSMIKFEKKDENIYISKIIHSSYIKVDEKGTKAAAATGVVPLTYIFIM